jgi:hypothetical protein
MKNLIKLVGIVAFVVIIGFSMVACDTDDGGADSNPFEGTWNGMDPDGDKTIAIVGSSTFTLSWPDNSSYGSQSGTYTYSGNTAALKVDGDTWGSATVSGNTLTIMATRSLSGLG